MGLGLLVKYIQNQKKQNTPAPVVIENKTEENKMTNKSNTVLNIKKRKTKKYDTVLNLNEE